MPPQPLGWRTKGSGVIEAELGESIVLRASPGAPVDPSSAVGIEILDTTTRFGLAFFQPGSFEPFLLTAGYPQDFFVFERTPWQAGTFVSVSGLLEPVEGLATRRPTATLVVSRVPEPATWLLLGMSGIALVAWRGRHHD